MVLAETQKPKAKAALTGWASVSRRRLGAHNVCCLESLRSLGEVELDGLALIQAPVSILLDSGEMHKNVLARGPLNEPVTLGSVKPLHSTFLSHNPLLSTTYLEYPASRTFPFPRPDKRHARTQPDNLGSGKRLYVAGKQGLRLSSQLFCK